MAEEVKSVNSESQDTEELDPIVQQILGAKADQDQQPQKGEQPESQDAKKGEEEQSIEGGYTLQEDEYEALTKELGYTDEDLNEFEEQDVRAILETKTKKPDGVETQEEIKEIVITPQMAKDFKFAKNLIGKPIAEAFKTIDNQNKFNEKLQSEVNQLKKNLTDNQAKKADDLVKELKEIDPIDLDKGQFIAKIQQLVDVLKEEQKPPAPDPKEMEERFFADLESQLPEGMDARAVFIAWNAGLSDAKRQLYGATDVRIVMDLIAQHAIANLKETKMHETETKLEETEKEHQKKVRLKAAELAREAYRKSKGQPISGSKVNVISRQEISRYDEFDPVVQEIFKSHEG